MDNEKKIVKEYISAGCIVISMIENNFTVLLLYKEWNSTNVGWVPPKGKIEEGETLEEGALRETKEETGISDLRIIDFLKSNSFEYDWEDGMRYKKTIHWFLAYSDNRSLNNTKLTEHEKLTQKEVKWFSLEDAITQLKFDNEKELIKMAQRILKKKGYE